MGKGRQAAGQFPTWLRAWIAEHESDPCEVGLVLGYSHKAVEAWLAGRGPRADDQTRVRLILEARGEAGLDLVRTMKRQLASMALGLPPKRG